MPRGGHVHVTCSNARLAPTPDAPGVPRPYVRISVKDQGAGIPAEHLERIFDPYFTTKPSGTGLGLAVSHAVIKNHGGLLQAESAVGTGTVFHILLPRSVKRVAPVASPPIVAIPHGKGRVLVMDDDRSIASVTASMLRSLGYSPDIVSDGEMAVERYVQAMEAGDPYDVVVMDLTVPGGMGGAQALAELRGHDPQVCAVVMSGYRSTPSGKQFLIHNSWGESWGDKGYAWVSEAMVKKFMHHAYKVKLGGAQKPKELTDDDCGPDDLVDGVTGQCAPICPDDSRPMDGC